MTRATYDTIGKGYANKRRADPRFFAQILEALGNARTIVNVGAGAGSYEPDDRFVVAVDPSIEMIRQRTSAAPVVQGDAVDLPFGSGSFDAALATLTIHHWPDADAGLEEMQRVATHQVVLTHTIEDLHEFWLTRDYFPEVIEMDLKRFQPLGHVVEKLGARVEVVPVPADCTDGHLGAYWQRPEAYLDPEVRAGMSVFPPLDQVLVAERIGRLTDDLSSGRWEERNGYLREIDSLDLGYRLVIA